MPVIINTLINLSGNGASSGGTSAPKPIPTLLELRQTVGSVAGGLRKLYGERSAVIVGIGIPIENGHDRCSATITGPCLMSRGLLVKTNQFCNEVMDSWETRDDDSSHNPPAPAIPTPPTTDVEFLDLIASYAALWITRNKGGNYDDIVAKVRSNLLRVVEG